MGRALQAVLRLPLDPIRGRDGASGIPEPLKRRLALVGGAADFVALEARMRALSRAAAEVFRRLIVVPAGTAAG